MTASADVKLLQAVDHVRVVYRRWLPEAGVRAAIHIVHGASEHSGRYGRLAAALTGHGFAVYAMDLRGHGRTAESSGPGRFGVGGGVETVLRDVAGLHDVIRDAHPGVPLFLLGHSMGTGIALGAAEEHGSDLAGLVLSGPMGVDPRLADTVTAVEAAVAAGAGDQVADLFGPLNGPFEPARTPFDWLSRDPAEVDTYLADPLSGEGMPLTYAFVAEVFGLAVRAATPDGAARLPGGLPVLLLTGQRDPVGGVDAANVVALADLLRGRGLPVEQHIYPDARHEVFNETNRDEVVADLLAWLERHVTR